MPIEWGAVGASKTAFDLIKWVIAKVRGRHAALSNVEILQLRSKWKPIIDDHIARCRRDGLGQDVTVRDIRRSDEYPDDKSGKKGNSAWFRAGLVGTNESSALLLLDWISVNPRAVEFMNFSGIAKENAEVSGDAALIGYVPFEQIIEVNWQGDDYSSRPSLFLHFDAHRSACSRLALCRRKSMEAPGGQAIDWYSEICNLEDYRYACARTGVSRD